MNPLALVELARAVDFAARKHKDQRRKGVTAEPYVNHPAEVARLVAEATGGNDAVVVLGAVLHDTIEDTETTREELEREFGPEVAALVVEVTDDKSLPKETRKQLQVEHAPHKSPRAKMIKLADKTSNLLSIALSPPAEWDERRKREYFDWAARVVAGCRGVNQRLEDEFDRAYRDGLSRLDAAQRGIAPALYQAISRAAAAVALGVDPEAASQVAHADLIAAGFARVDYVAVRDARTLGTPAAGRPMRVLAAAWLGKTRLIDNVPA
jgi:hypothetical protein